MDESSRERLTRKQEVGQGAVKLTVNAQTADVLRPEPRPAVELPIWPHNALYKAD